MWITLCTINQQNERNLQQCTPLNLTKKTKNKRDQQQKEAAYFRSCHENSVTISNALARAFYRSSTNEKRVMAMIVSKLDPRRTDNNIQRIEIRAKDFIETYNTCPSNAYRDIARAAQALIRKIIVIEEDDGSYTEYTLMCTATYIKKEGKIIASLNPNMQHHFQGLKEKFTSYPLGTASRFKSSYSWKLYELLVSWSKPKQLTKGIFSGWLTVEVDNLRKILGVPKSYAWTKFNTEILQKTQEELYTKAGIKIDILSKKTGRKIAHLYIQFMEESH